MYSHYMDGAFAPLHTEEKRSQPCQQEQTQKNSYHRQDSILGEMTGGLSKLLHSVKKQFHTDHLDTGDILLVLIILFLFLEGDNLELVITLGLMLLLGLDDGQ